MSMGDLQEECWTESGPGFLGCGTEGVEGNKGGIVTRVGKGPKGWGALEDFCMVRAEWGGKLGRRWLPRQGRGQKGAVRGKRVYCKSLPVQCDGNLRRLS